jgi:hypothetical protein
MEIPLHAFTGNVLGTKLLFARWTVDDDLNLEEAVSQFHSHGARYFCMWIGDDGTHYGIARVSTVTRGD